MMAQTPQFLCTASLFNQIRSTKRNSKCDQQYEITRIKRLIAPGSSATDEAMEIFGYIVACGLYARTCSIYASALVLCSCITVILIIRT